MKKLFLFGFWKSWKHKHPNWSLGKAIFGFTLIEMLVVMLIVGVLSAIVGPTWLGAFNRQRLSESQNQIFRAVKEAQSNAKRTKEPWQASFRSYTGGSDPAAVGTAQVAVHKSFSTTYTPTAADIDSLPWKSVVSNVQINTALTTALAAGTPTYYSLQFDSSGLPNRGLNDQRKVTLSYGSQNGARACVIVSTLIGGMRTAFDADCIP